jgi:hypothetical protein
MSPGTDYNSLLLFHEVGVGKTCTAISIAEQFRTIFQKKIIVVMPTKLKDNFKNQIFDVSRINRKNLDIKNQCVANAYLDAVPDRHLIDNATLEKRITQIIRASYQFYGFREFANTIIKVEEGFKKNDSRSEAVDAKVNKYIKETYSDCVFIIDEVHNVRAETKETRKLVPPIMSRLFHNATNVKLVILTATPMFNDSIEIVWLINLILANEKKPQISETDIFDTDGTIHAEGRNLLAKKTRGYVSFMRGQNPFSFPTRFTPKINGDTNMMKLMPKHDIYKQTLAADKKLSNKTLIEGRMSDFQTSMYKTVERIDVDDDGEDDEEEEGAKANNLSKPIQISNIVYPGGANNVDHSYGKVGFLRCFDKLNTKMLKVRYKPAIKTQYGEFLDPTGGKLKDYSAKIKNIVDYILNAQGIVFVYSSYLWGGILPIAIALEHAGFKRRNGNNILQDSQSSQSANLGNYTMLTSDLSIVTDIQVEIDAIRAPSNIDGKDVKVVLGTNVTSEGIDFKCIREVHILEPWHHLNRTEQIIGRAVRTCSHTALDAKFRNTTVFNHVATPAYYPEVLVESIDLRMYRLGEIKQRQIKIVENILKSNSIDCLLNKDISYFDQNVLNIKQTITTSQGTVVKNFKLGDDPVYSQYSQIQCAVESKDNLASNASTFLPIFYKDEIGIYQDAIQSCFIDYAQTFNIKELGDKLALVMTNVDSDIMKFALDDLIRNKKVISRPNVRGLLVYHGHQYTMIPYDDPFSYVTNHSRANYKVRQSNRIEIKGQSAVVNTGPVSTIIQTTLAKVAELVDSLVTQIPNDKFYRAAVDYVIDRMLDDEFALLAKAVYRDESVVDKNILDSMVQSHRILKNKKVLYLRLLQGEDLVLAGTLPDLDFKPISPFELANYYKLEDPLTIAIGTRNIRSYVGYIDLVDGAFNFKLLGAAAKSDGFNCISTSTFQLSDVRKCINDIDENMHTFINGTKRVVHCHVYEIMLRYNDPAKFARTYEALRVPKLKKHAKKK